MSHDGRTAEGAQQRQPFPNRRYKDSLFRNLFGTEENRPHALSLYNALAGTSYDDPDALELNTLDDVLFMGMRNDVSFLIGDELVLWEHQSTPNPNMPLRGLLYFARLYDEQVKRLGKSVHASSLIELPTPRLVVFYNGRANRPDREVLLLSSAFSGRAPDIEVAATVINVNEGRNPELAAACEALRGYSFLVARTRELCGTMELRDALSQAIDDCIGRGYLADYLARRRSDVMFTYLTEWDEEAYREILREEGVEEGMEKGMEKGLLHALRGYMASTGAGADAAMEALDVPRDMRARLSSLV